MEIEENELNHIDTIKMLEKEVESKQNEWKKEKSKLLAKLEEG